MKSESPKNFPTFTDNNELIKPYLKNWFYFVLSVILAVCLAYTFIRYSVPEYAINAKIQILEDQTATSELGAFSDLGVLGGTRNNVQDEIETLNSRTNLIKVVKKLGLNKKIVALGNIKDTPLYKNPPFVVNFLAPDSIIQKTTHEFFIKLDSDTTFKFANEEGSEFENHAFGNPIPSSLGNLIITPSIPNIEKLSGRNYKVKVSPLATVADFYQRNILISVTDDFSNIISITLNDAIQERGIDIINTYINEYNLNAVDDKKAIADKTSNFINDRITEIYGSLSNVDQTAEEFKSGRGIADIASQTDVNLNVGAANQQELQNASVQLDIAASMKDLIDSQEGYDLLPSNIGLSDPSIASTTARYNELALERKRLLESSNEKNPIIVNLDQQLEGLKRSMQSSLNSTTNNLELQVNSLSRQISRINSRIYSAPKNERALRDITRQQQTTESLYLYLLQKREEAQISFASAAPKSKIIDQAYLVSEEPVSPKKTIIYLAAIILGLLIPFSVIYLNDLLDNKIKNKVNLEKITGDIPVLAELPKINKKEDNLIKTNERTVLAESLRILRTNLDYILNSKLTRDKKGRVIFVTSSVPGEGKTLVSFNLAMIYSNASKKVLLIGADIRNPKIFEFYNGKNVDKLAKTRMNKDNKGLTDFLSNKELESKDIISSILANNQTIDIIFAGKIPPNPTELLMSNKIDELFEYVKDNYDYIIVDTAPLMVVSDTLLISNNADQTLYVTRAGLTERSVISQPVRLQEEGKLKGLSFIVNGVKSSNLGYGGKYGYGYGTNKKKWFQIFG